MNIDQIIGKLMGDGSVGEEKSALEAWKKEAEDNIKALEDIKKIASLSSSLSGYEDFNADEAWDSFSSRLDEDNNTDALKERRATPIFSIKNISRIAAILVVVTGSIFLFNQYSNPSTPETSVKLYSATVEKMTFDLEDGSNVTLDKNSELKVINDRDVALIGRAYFKVAKDESKQFNIDLPVGKVVVLGTEFTIDANENTTEVYVEEGSVRYELGNRTWKLEEGELVRVSDNDTIKLTERNEN